MASNPFLDGALRVVRDVALRAIDRATAPQARRRATRRPAEPTRSPRPPAASGGYPGDYRQAPTIVYNPHRDGRPDPGEVVWTWVPYEEDSSQGKDRPVLLIGRDGGWLLGLQVTSQDHDVDAAQEADAGRYWTDIGTGEWDNQRRPSEVRVNRIIRIDPDAVRRVGAILDEQIFDAVARKVRRHY
ncbi:type II toxin-antitoxin system PemK/MazF family toxin [Tessaracoccus sp. MC1627]|uniref:type II toxin-antitoxin system PemK/MazF family toxin n=1 Tax=Tessaracoccus sp. MC1627 TaxID=2760312 RepID=UPI0016021486|nr:type II toxin-antitoxin system PemK/MazF family toxin [Tessaracoccus sp. MC1627]MBB1512035.1 type II toxin-antitoxin system PemK/MazF family toxin [Tessaracoccus sp. MC1627]